MTSELSCRRAALGARADRFGSGRWFDEISSFFSCTHPVLMRLDRDCSQNCGPATSESSRRRAALGARADHFGSGRWFDEISSFFSCTHPVSMRLERACSQNCGPAKSESSSRRAAQDGRRRRTWTCQVFLGGDVPGLMLSCIVEGAESIARIRFVIR